MDSRWINTFDKIVEYSLYAIIFFIPFSSAGVETFFGFAFLGFIIKKSLKPDFAFLKSRPNFFLLLFIIFNALSLFNSGPYINKGFKALIFKWAEYVIIFLMAQDTLSTRRRIKNAAIVILSVALVIGIDGFFQKFNGIDFLRHRLLIPKEDFFAISASFSHYNDFATYLVVVLSIAIALIIARQPKRINKLILSAEIAILSVCLLFTSSRGGWLGFIFALILIIFLTRKVKEISFLICIFIIMIISIPELRNRTIFTLLPGGDADRIIMWKTAIKMISENPFLGKGLGTFMDYFHKYTPNLYVQYAHNCFLQIWAETGIFSLASLLLFIGSILYRGIKQFKKDNDFILLGLIAGIFGFLVHSFLDTNLYSLQLATLFWMLMGIISAKIKHEDIQPAG